MIANLLLLIAVIALTFVAGSAVDFSKLSHPKETMAAASQAVIPDVAFKTLSGKTSHLHDYKGRVIVLNFWASWCAPCVAEFPLLLSLARSLPEDVTLIAMSLDENPDDLTRFLKKYGGDYKSLPNVVIARDPDRAISQRVFSTVKLPETIIIGPGGAFHRKIVGYSEEWKSLELQAELKSLITEH